MYTLFFLFLHKNIDCGYHNLCFEQNFEKISDIFIWKFSFSVVKFSVCLNRHVFVMFYKMVVCWVYSLDEMILMIRHNIHFHDKKEHFPKIYLNICFLELSAGFPKDSKTEFESTTVNSHRCSSHCRFFVQRLLHLRKLYLAVKTCCQPEMHYLMHFQNNLKLNCL